MYAKIFNPKIVDGKIVDREFTLIANTSLLKSSLKRWINLTDNELDHKILSEGKYIRPMTKSEENDYLGIKEEIKDKPKKNKS